MMKLSKFVASLLVIVTAIVQTVCLGHTNKSTTKVISSSQLIYTPQLGTGLSQNGGLETWSYAGPFRIGNFTYIIQFLCRSE